MLGFVHFFTMLCTLTIFASLVRIDPRLRLAAADLGAAAGADLPEGHAAALFAGRRDGRFPHFVVAIGDFVTPQILGGNTQLLLPQLSCSRSTGAPTFRWHRRFQ